jgi:hypothetical protein
LQRKIDGAHLRVEVWEKKHDDRSLTVSVTFGGTIFNNEMDWRANLRWFLPGNQRDEYSAVVHEFAPAFEREFLRRTETAATRDGNLARNSSVELISTGHSLGGGLAQQLAYCLCLNDKVPRVSKVYAFDPSPVTGFFSVRKAVRDFNRQNLKIDRIYERGEILAIVRSMTSLIWRPSTTAPSIRGLRYFLFFAWNPIVGHSMMRMAVRMDAAAHVSSI